MVNLFGISYNPYIGQKGILKIIEKDIDRMRKEEQKKNKNIQSK